MSYLESHNDVDSEVVLAQCTGTAPLALLNLFTNGCAPTDSERRQSQATITSTRRQLSTLNSEIKTLKQALAKLTAQKKQLFTQLTLYESALAPIRRIPREILVEIFTHCVPQWPTSNPRVTEIPLLFEHVCKYWKTVVQSTPKLWTQIGVDAGYPHSDPDPSMVQLWLTRSAKCPIDVCIDVESPSFSLDVILLHSDRWRKLDLTITLEHISVLSPIRGKLSSLEHLDLTVIGEEDSLVTRIDHFFSAPNLSIFHSRGIGTDNFAFLRPTISFNDLALPWTQLTQYSGRLTAADLFRLIQAAPNLVSLEAHIKWKTQLPTDQPPIHPIVPMQRLKRLNLRFPLVGPSDVLSHLPSCPNLREFSIKAVGGLGSTPEALNSLLAKSATHLEKIEFRCIELKDHHIIEALRFLPNLIDLIISDNDNSGTITDKLLSYLTLPPRTGNTETPPSLPQLKVIRLDMYDAVGPSVQVLISMIQSRLATLKSVQIVVDCHECFCIPTPLVIHAQSLQRSGFDICLSFNGNNIDGNFRIPANRSVVDCYSFV
ncbi:hypothetical protein AMATHDRAFT_61219 [Amanita thiersii Skay4041]|uniref:Uncharacterized protein n=1 Tax=Amanita thiersii Skay4041 TaxID=703135 RepID=A0A2A9NRU7_9AGAR|nr:hypothetical protein AMATHDRAFT_61219 [Amanita thiersii Skay4041]